MKIDLNGVNVHYSSVDNDFYLSALVSGGKNNSQENGNNLKKSTQAYKQEWQL
jgi:hypothetical protein